MWTLARKILLHDHVKFVVATAGVAFSVLLVLSQLGVYAGAMRSASTLIDHSDADLWVTGQGNENFDFAAPMDERVYYRVLQTAGVGSAEKLVVTFGQWKMPRGGTQGVQVVGIDHGQELLRPWNVVAGDRRELDRLDGIFVDETEFTKLGIEATGDSREISGLRSQIVGLTTGIRSFTTTPFVFTNLATARAYGNMNGRELTYVLVRAAPETDLEELKRRLAEIPFVDVYASAAFSERTRSYWSARTGVGIGFFTNAVIGIIVGLVVVGQILYSGTIEHIKEYGTLKAMGASNGAIVRVILYQALISAGVGFVVGCTLAVAMRAAVRATNLNLVLSPELLAGTAVLTAVMCSAAALLSVAKVLRLDPATVFKG